MGIIKFNDVYINETASGELTVYSINLSNNEKTEILKNTEKKVEIRSEKKVGKFFKKLRLYIMRA